jgi:hypothetical protein
VSCPHCFKKFTRGTSHTCYLARPALKVSSTKYIAYDFECCLNDENIHIPYLVCASFVYEKDHTQIIDHLKTKFTYQLEKDKTVFIFWGLNDSFIHFLLEPVFEKFTFIAHNARSYDLIFIKNWLMQRKLYTNDVRRGKKFLSCKVPSLKITFIDSLSFIPSSLRAMSKDFKVEEFKKGYFPYKLVTETYLLEAEKTHYNMPSPTREDYLTNYRSKSEEREALDWIYQRFNQPETTWNVKEEAVAYCLSDVLVLSEVIQKFREQTLEMTSRIERVASLQPKEIRNLDPFQYMTLPSAIMKFYLSQVLEDEILTPIDRYNTLSERNADNWYSYQKALHPGQWIASPRGKGWIRNNQECYIYLDCYLDGCTKCNHLTDKNHRDWQLKTFEEVRYFTEVYLDSLYPLTVHTCWSCNDPSELGDNCRLDPREAYKGGKVEVYKYRYDGPIQMVDFVSQYPAVMLGCTNDPLSEDTIDWELPAGSPIITRFPETIDLTACGIIKCLVLPPRDCYAPTLSYRAYSSPKAYKVLYGNCRSCMNEKSQECVHEDESERYFFGTWCITEIQQAVSIGYRVIKYIESWIYPDASTCLFEKFIQPFMIEKITSKKDGLVEQDSFTPNGLKVKKYLDQLTGKCFAPTDFENLPSKRTVAKLIQNSFTGKWGQKESNTTTETFYASQVKQCVKLLWSGDNTIDYIEAIDHDTVLVIYSRKQAIKQDHLFKHDLIVAHITAYGRMMINKLEIALGTSMLYCDTDSAYHKTLPFPPYRTGFLTGDLELEIPEGRNFYAIGRKAYGCEVLKNGEFCPKLQLKGVQMNLLNLEQFKRVPTLELIVRTKRALEEDEDIPFIATPQILFSTEITPSSILKRTNVIMKKTRIHLKNATRVLKFGKDSIDSFPYGFKRRRDRDGF